MAPEVDWTYVGHLLWCRTGGTCEGCGRPHQPGVRELSIHHRRTRGMGGTSREDVHDLANLLHLCAGFSRRLAGVLGCHGLVDQHPTWAQDRGLVVLQGADPAATPLVLPSGRRVLLDALGPGYLTPPDGPAWVLIADPDTPRQV